MSKSSNQNPIVPVRIDPELKKQFQLAQKADGYKCLATWIKAQCERRVAELHMDKIEARTKYNKISHQIAEKTIIYLDSLLLDQPDIAEQHDNELQGLKKERDQLAKYVFSE